MVTANALTAKDWYDRAYELKRGGDFTAALDAFKQSIRLNSRVAAPWIGLATLLDANNQLEDARECLKCAASADPKHLMASQQLARSHQKLGYVEDARLEYQRALQLDPNSKLTYYGLGQLQEDLGEPEEAADAYRKATKLDPSDHDALANLLGLGRHVDISAELDEATKLVANMELKDKALVGYGLGKAHEQREDYDAAFSAFQIANSARRELAGPFNRDAFDARIAHMMGLFSEKFFEERNGWGDPSARAVFIVGLPRSGTTLTEQIIGSHPDCFGAGELNTLTDLATGVPDRLGCADPPWPDCVVDLEQQQLAELGRDYLNQSSDRSPTRALRVVDKQPLNFWHLGLIAVALPNARIIHCTRDIRDCGLSIFSQNFNLQQKWATDLSDVVHYWRGYRQLMDHWASVTGLEIVKVVYEDTVSDLEPQARRLLDFLDLSWDPSVLRFHENERAVQTPSRWQVRQPIYQSSKARWRRFEAHLEPLLQAAKSE